MLDTNLFLNIPVAMAIAVIALWTEGKIGEKERVVLHAIADCVFGIYLIHTFVQYLFAAIGLEEYLFGLPEIIAIPAYTVALFFVSLLLAWMLRMLKFGKEIT